MFHPTVFENLKVAFENYIYDLDNNEGVITITNREDILDMAVMSRCLALQFSLSSREDLTAEVRVRSSVESLAAEILEQDEQQTLCALSIRFQYQVQDVSSCSEAEEIMRSIWGTGLPIKQTIHYEYEGPVGPAIYGVEAELVFNRKIGEGQIEDIPELTEHMIRTLGELAVQL